MNETPRSPSATDAPWPTSGTRVKVPDTSMLPGSEIAPAPAVKLLNQAVQGAHDTIDRLAVGAAPVARELGARVEAAGDMLHAKANQLRDSRDEWVESARTTVRKNPLAWVACAAVIGALIARITHKSHNPHDTQSP